MWSTTALSAAWWWVQDVVHRDLKPENVLLHGGAPVLADFGMSFSMRRRSDGSVEDGNGNGASRPLAAGGTPLYTAPEVMMAMFKNTGMGHAVGPKVRKKICG